MSKRRSPDLFLFDMSQAVEKIISYSSGLSLEQLMHDEIRKDAILRNIQVLGDAAKNLPPDYIRSHPEIDWEGIAGLRDVITHQYFRVDWTILWVAIGSDLPLLARQLSRALDTR